MPFKTSTRLSPCPKDFLILVKDKNIVSLLSCVRIEFILFQAPLFEKRIDKTHTY